MNTEMCKKLQIDDVETYKELENRYKEIFEKFILSEVNLSKYDDEITNSDLDFGNCTNKQKLYSQLNEYLNLNHIYILNNFFIEKLSIEALNVLKNGSYEEALNIIKLTYKEVIKNNFYKNRYVDKIYKISYGMYPTPYNMADNNELVFMIYYGLNTKKYNKEEYLKNYREKKNKLAEISNKIVEEVSNKLEIPVKVMYRKIT